MVSLLEQVNESKREASNYFKFPALNHICCRIIVFKSPLFATNDEEQIIAISTAMCHLLQQNAHMRAA